MKKEFIEKWPAYSKAIKVDLWNAYMIFVTWQIAKKDWKVVCQDIEWQTEYIFLELNRILKESWASLDDVVKAQIFLTDINDFSKVSPIRNKYFEKSKPTSTLVEINKTVQDWCKIEIEVIAIKAKN